MLSYETQSRTWSLPCFVLSPHYQLPLSYRLYNLVASGLSSLIAYVLTAIHVCSSLVRK